MAIEFYKIKENYKKLEYINDYTSGVIKNVYENNHWDLKLLFSEYMEHCKELGKECKIAWDNDIQYLDYKWDNINASEIIKNKIILKDFAEGSYKSLYTIDKKDNSISTEESYAKRIAFFVKTFPCFYKYKNTDDLSWVAINNKELLSEIMKYHNDKKRSISTINKDLKAMVRVIKLLVGEDNELRFKFSALQIAFTDIENNRDDENIIATDNEKKQFVSYEKLLNICQKLKDDYDNDIKLYPAIDRNNGLKHSNKVFQKHQILLALALNVWDYPLRHEKYSMDIVNDESVLKDGVNYIIIKQLQKEGKYSKNIKFVFNEIVKGHKSISYNIESKLITEHNKELCSLIKYSLETYPRPNLFIGKDNWERQKFNKATVQTICIWLKDISDIKNICIDGMRSAFVSYYYPKINNRQKEILKTRMRTSKDVIERSYLKYENTEEPLEPNVIEEETNEIVEPNVNVEPNVIEEETNEIVEPNVIEEETNEIVEPNVNVEPLKANVEENIDIHEASKRNYKLWYAKNKAKKLEYNKNRNINPEIHQRVILNYLNTGKAQFNNYKQSTVDKYGIYVENGKYYGRVLNNI